MYQTENISKIYSMNLYHLLPTVGLRVYDKDM